jgi:hypothetical protein
MEWPGRLPFGCHSGLKQMMVWDVAGGAIIQPIPHLNHYITLRPIPPPFSYSCNLLFSCFCRGTSTSTQPLRSSPLRAPLSSWSARLVPSAPEPPS